LVLSFLLSSFFISLTREDEPRRRGEYTGPLEEDLGNLMVSDNAPIEDEILGSKEKLEERSRAVLQRLIVRPFIPIL